jgi:uncharacterized protein YmfQ (DUF2313 family)
MLFFRILQHLLPTAEAWQIAIEKKLRRFFQGMAPPLDDVRTYVDQVHGDGFPDTTRELAEWERQFGLTPNPDEDVRRLQLAAAWASGGGQSLRYLQDVLQTAGFPLFIHEWWVPPDAPTRVARDPRSYADQPLFGTVQCREPRAQCGEPTAQCNRFLVNDVHYLVNKRLTFEAPPPIPADPARWRHFFYVGGETFPDVVQIDGSRRDELERLLLKIRPTQNWIVLRIDYVTLSGGPHFVQADLSTGFVQVNQDGFVQVSL